MVPVAAVTLVIGLGVGLLIKGWSPVLILAAACLVVSALGVGFGWFGDSDVAPLGGAIIMAMYFWGPLLIGMSIGVSWRRRRRTAK